MDLYYVITFQWPVGNGYAQRHMTGPIQTDSAKPKRSEVIEELIKYAVSTGVPANHTILFLSLERNEL